MVDFFDDLAKSTGNKYQTKASDGIFGADVTGWVDTGSYALNALVSGSIYKGIPRNKRFQLAGESSTGKTFYSLEIFKNFLNDYKNSQAFVWDSEGAITEEMLDSRNIDKSRFRVLHVNTIEEFRTQCLRLLDKIIESGEKVDLILGLDSLGMLSSNKEVGDMGDGKDTRDMTKAQLMKGTFRALTLKLGHCNCALVMTNHTYKEIGLFPKTIAGGGSGPYYASDNIVFLRKKKEKEGTDIIGNIVTCVNHKSRHSKENKLVETRIDYDKGLDRYYGLVDIAVQGGVFKKVSTKIELPDGTKVFKKTLDNNPEKYYTKEILDAIDKVAADIFLYGHSTEDQLDDEMDELTINGE